MADRAPEQIERTQIDVYLEGLGIRNMKMKSSFVNTNQLPYYSHWIDCYSISEGAVHKVVEFGTPPTSYPKASVPPPFGTGGRAHSLARGVRESPNSDEGTYWLLCNNELFFWIFVILWYTCKDPELGPGQ